MIRLSRTMTVYMDLKLRLMIAKVCFVKTHYVASLLRRGGRCEIDRRLFEVDP